MTSDPENNLRYQRMVIGKHFGPLDGSPETWPRERQRAGAAMYRFASQGYYLRGNSLLGQYYLRLALEANPLICESLDLFYDLGCVDQPLGQRGDITQLNLAKNATALFASLDQIFSQPDLSPRLHAQKNKAYGYAAWALGLLAYGSNNLRKARVYLWQALITEPTLRTQSSIWLTLFKSLMGESLLRYSKSIRSFFMRML